MAVLAWFGGMCFGVACWYLAFLGVAGIGFAVCGTAGVGALAAVRAPSELDAMSEGTDVFYAEGI